MSSRTFATSTASTDNNWTEPVKITGDSGKPGVDGITTEFIYCRQDKQTKPQPMKQTKRKIPNEWLPTGWTEPTLKIKGRCSTRNKTVDEHGTSTWGAWGNPFRWARWGVDGKDGCSIHIFTKKNIR